MTFNFALLIALRSWFTVSFHYSILTKLIEIKVHLGKEHQSKLTTKGNNGDHQASFFSQECRFWCEADKTNKAYAQKHVSELNCKESPEGQKRGRKSGRSRGVHTQVLYRLGTGRQHCLQRRKCSWRCHIVGYLDIFFS